MRAGGFLPLAVLTLALGGAGRAYATVAPRLPGFAAAFSEQPVIAGPQGWRVLPDRDAWSALIGARGAGRQSARWRYATSLIGQGRWPEAIGVLDVMAADDPDIALIPSWRLARGAALVSLRRYDEALSSLAVDALAANPEACAWRMRLLAETGRAPEALGQVRCAVAAINARKDARRTPFVIAAGRAALDSGNAALALQVLKALPDQNVSADLYRGRASCALHHSGPGKERLERTRRAGNPEERAAAALALVECDLADHRMTPAAALPKLDRIGFSWRGGPVEQQALRLSWQLAAQAGNLRGSLTAGATLFRHFNLGSGATPLLIALQGQLTSALAQGTLPVDQAAGLYWDFRDLAPSGAEGDLLVSQLADRLEASGLYGRAAELLHYQLGSRTSDVAQGPLSAKVGRLFILAGQPKLAIEALQETEATPYPAEMRWERHRVEAAALQLLGRSAEALAVLSDVPDAARLRSEIYWQQRDWTGLAEIGGPLLPASVQLSDVEQAMVLRHAIALAMLNRGADLERLRARYLKSFARLPTGATFSLLTGAPSAIDPEMISRAMAALPGTSPAGQFADLLDAAPNAPRQLSRP
jgi:tetratricopeptide (TPR) repeat protein